MLQNITLKLYDVFGNEVTTLVNDEKLTGSYEVEFSGQHYGGQSLSSEVYSHQLKAGSFIETKKMILLR